MKRYKGRKISKKKLVLFCVVFGNFNRISFKTHGSDVVS